MPNIPRLPSLHVLLAALAGLLILAGCIKREDSFPAVITITEPKAGTARSTEQINVFGYALDDRGIMAIRVDGVDLLSHERFASERGKSLVHFGFTGQAIREGELTYLIEVVDADGNVTSLNYTLTVDITPPTLELSVTALGGGRFNLVGTARDNIAVSSMRIGGVPYTFIPGPEVTFDLANVSPEVRTIEIFDSAGNSHAQEF